MKIRGKHGGELLVLLNKQANAMTNKMMKSNGRRDASRCLSVDCYRTRGILSLDVSRYHGNKNEKIVIKLDSQRKQSMHKVCVYVISPEMQLIEHGRARKLTIKRPYNKRNGLYLHYRVKKSHQHDKVKIIFCEKPVHVSHL